MYFPISLTFIAGTVVAKRFYVRLGDIGIMNVGATLVISGAIFLNVVTLLLDVTAAWQIIAPFSLVT